MSQSPFRIAPFRSFLTLHPDRASWAPLRVCALRHAKRLCNRPPTRRDNIAYRPWLRGERFSLLLPYGGLISVAIVR